MFTLNIKPKKDHNNNDYINISNDDTENNNILLIDLKTINLENISVELALNVLQLKHSVYNDMNQNDMIQYYNNKIKMTNNINTILALKIILKSKLKGADIKINKMNGIMISKQESSINSNNKNKIIGTESEIEKKINSLKTSSNSDFKIQQVQHNNFKIVQKNIIPGINKNLVQFSNNSQNYYSDTKNLFQSNQSNHTNHTNQSNHTNQTNQLNHTNQTNQSNQSYQSNQTNQYYLPPNQSNQTIQNSYYEQYSQLNQYNMFNNKNTLDEKINNMVVVNSSEFDIDTIINSYSQKKNQGLIK